ncbi:DUF309 domain-containing protein [Halalkalibacter oceani]|uniref:DUF309 domain-containing protein n=1 Tax=Halalkalibacter oceani TaxID=1653776 RepID=A0A9X2IPM0_9BACI|nr:DUF309 domain-containing protein [Halalkalibacter oceani]MCM3713693.1 DUF309 domain-containing protein [Halalkalibacter oceani]
MYPTPYLDYLIEFHVRRDYFECHELLEEYWKEQPREQRHHYWVALIQLAVGLYHHRRSNIAGAERMYQKAAAKIAAQPDPFRKLGLNPADLHDQLNKQLQFLTHTPPVFQDMTLSLSPDLQKACDQRCKELGLSWRTDDPATEEFIIHKHLLRDRKEVIAERERQWVIRRQEKGLP